MVRQTVSTSGSSGMGLSIWGMCGDVNMAEAWSWHCRCDNDLLTDVTQL
jgi:hypothetical protein